MSRNNRLFSPSQARSFTSYPQQPQARIDARAPLSHADQVAQDRGTNAAPAADWSKTFRPAGQREGMQGTGAPKPLDVSTPAIQGLLDKAAGIAPTSPTSTATKYGTGSVRFDKAGGGLAANGAGKSEIIKDEKGNEIGVGRVSPDGQSFDINAARQNLYAAHPEVFQAGTPENKAFTAYANAHGEQAAHENATQIMQPIMNDRLAGATPSSAQARSALPSAGSSEDVISKAATDKALAGMAKEKSDAGPFDKDSAVGRALTAINNTPSLGNAAGDFVQSKAKSLLGLNDDTAKAAGDYARNAVGGAADAATDKVANLFTPSATSTPAPNAEELAATRAGMQGAAVGANVQPSSPVASAPVIQPTAANTAAPKDEEVPNYAGGMLPPMRAPFTPGLSNLSQMQSSSASRAPLASASATPGLSAMATAPRPAPMQTPGLDHQAQMQASAASGSPLATASHTPGLDAMARVPNHASGFTPDSNRTPFTPSAPAGELAGEQSFKSNAEAGNQAAEGNLKAAGYGDTPVTTQTLGGHPEDTAHGYGQEEGWDKVPSYAKGRLFAPAMARERKAIAKHVGGAPKSAKPVPVVMAGQPAVLNSSEAVVPNAAGGMPAVLTRNQQKRMFAPSRR